MADGGLRVPVFTDLAEYGAAVAALAISASPADSSEGAIVVLPGGGDWWTKVLEAQTEGAAAVVVADPREAPTEQLDELLRSLTVPLVIERPRMRPDVAAQVAGAGVGIARGAVTVECAATAGEFPTVVRDAVGWARLVAGGPLVLHHATATAQSCMGLLEGSPDAGAPLLVPVMANAMTAGRPGGLIRLMSLGEVRVSVTVDVPAGICSVERASDQGALRLPEHFETSARLTLRRALDAVALGRRSKDLPDLLQDTRIAAGLLGAGASARGAEARDEYVL